MSFEIPAFTDDRAHCDPCGWPEADTTYVPAIVGVPALDRIVSPFGHRWPVFAFLKRTCTRCGFQWAEAPLPPRGPQCDVYLKEGVRCSKRADHFHAIRSPHRFPPSH